MVWAGWLYSQEWWRQELWRTTSPAGTTFEQAVQGFRKRFSADANDYILQARTWQRHDVGATPGFDGSVEKALRSIKARVLYMPSETDLYFPITDAATNKRSFPSDVRADSVVVGHTPGPRAIRQICGSSTTALPPSWTATDDR
jgi:homoserine O-acetyltransferase